MRRCNAIDLSDPVSDHPLNRGIVSWWLPLPHLKGSTTLFDLVKTGRNHGTLTNGPTWTAGRDGFGALQFDGSNDYVDCGLAGNFTTESFWIEFHVNPASLPTTGTGGNPVFVYKGAFNVGGWYVQCQQNSTTRDLVFVTNQSGANQQTKSVANVLTVGADHHVVVTRDGAAAKIYVNGSEVSYAASASHTNPASVATSMVIGRYLASAANFHVTGRMDFVRIGANRVPSASEVAALYDQFRRSYPDTLRRYSTARWFVGSAPGGGNRRRRVLLLGRN
jgi:hypothetical protein